MINATPIPNEHPVLHGSDATGGCTDQVIGDILSGWRYDISGVSPEMRTDYVQHFEDCARCRSRQRLHRTIDVTLMVISSVSIVVFLLATAVIHRGPFGQMTVAALHYRDVSFALTLQMAAVGGLLFSLLMWILVAIATPAPTVISGTVKQVRNGRGL
jgi:hypothetical protein